MVLILNPVITAMPWVKVKKRIYKISLKEFTKGDHSMTQSGRGGKREGAGRPLTPEKEKRKQRNFYLTEKENKKVKEYIEKLRAE